MNPPTANSLAVVAGEAIGVVATTARWWWCPAPGLTIEGRWWEGRPMPPRQGISIAPTLWGKLAAEIQAAAPAAATNGNTNANATT